jgi:hypothetical protein
VPFHKTNTMNMRKIGHSALHVAPLAFGGNVFGWTADEATSFKLLDAFVAAGFNLIDTADVYSRWAAGHRGGESETIIGNWLKKSGNRDRVVVATKVGLDILCHFKSRIDWFVFRALRSRHSEREHRADGSASARLARRSGALPASGSVGTGKCRGGALMRGKGQVAECQHLVLAQEAFIKTAT